VTGPPLPPTSPDDLSPEIYAELRAMAASMMRRERTDHTLQPSALAHEAYIRLQNAGTWASRAHFFAAAARAIRHVLIEHARKHHAAKRHAPGQRIAIEDVDTIRAGGGASGNSLMTAGLGGASNAGVDLLELDQALRDLEALDRRLHRVVELRFFGGLTMDEIAAALGVSKRTVESDWSIARAWLRRWFTGEDEGAS